MHRSRAAVRPATRTAVAAAAFLASSLLAAGVCPASAQERRPPPTDSAAIGEGETAHPDTTELRVTRERIAVAKSRRKARRQR